MIRLIVPHSNLLQMLKLMEVQNRDHRFPSKRLHFFPIIGYLDDGLLAYRYVIFIFKTSSS